MSSFFSLLRPYASEQAMYVCSLIRDHFVFLIISFFVLMKTWFSITEPSPPRFSDDQPREFNSSEGSKANLSCKASGIPPPVITWFKDGYRLQSSSVIGGKGYSILTFESVHLHDQGQYWCEANSTEGWNRSSSVNLKGTGTLHCFLRDNTVIIKAIFSWVLKVIRDCIGFALLRSVIGLENSRHPLNQSNAKQKPIASWSLAFSRACMRPVTCIYFCIVLVGNCWNFPLFGLTVVLNLVLVLRHSIENCSTCIWKLLNMFKNDDPISMQVACYI